MNKLTVEEKVVIGGKAGDSLDSIIIDMFIMVYKLNNLLLSDLMIIG